MQHVCVTLDLSGKKQELEVLWGITTKINIINSFKSFFKQSLTRELVETSIISNRDSEVLVLLPLHTTLDLASNIEGFLL